jgi:hypothetical protein
MSSMTGKRKNQGKQNGKWPEGAIKEEDEEVLAEEDDVEAEADANVEIGMEGIGRGSYDVGELDAVRRVDSAGGEVDGRSTSASV